MIAGICGPEPAAAPDRAAAAVTGNALGCAVPRPGGRVFGFAECCLVGKKKLIPIVVVLRKRPPSSTL